MLEFKYSFIHGLIALLIIPSSACSDISREAVVSADTQQSALEVPLVIINEVDADQTGTDSAEFIELFDGGFGVTNLSGLVLVLFNGANDSVYAAFDLDGYVTNSSGYFVLCGNNANTPHCDMDVSPDTNLVQNGADAVALYEGDADDFPIGAPVSTQRLLDALVYDTSDSDDGTLLDLLNPGEPQIDENAYGNKDTHSNQRCPDGEGGGRNTTNYSQWPPTPGAPNLCSDEPSVLLSCDDASIITLIHDVQGSKMASLLDGATVTIEGIVVGDFQNNTASDHGELNGFYLQEETEDADQQVETSEGIFIFAPNAPDVHVGDKLRVRGVVTEYVTDSGASSMTEISNVEIAHCSAGNTLPRAEEVLLPMASADWMERFEGMRVIFPQALTIAEYFNFDRYGQLTLALSPKGFDRPQQPTASFAPATSEAAELAVLNAMSRITLDDGRTDQNPDPARHPGGAPFDLTNRFRGGDLVKKAIGVIDETFGAYRIQPTGSADYISVNPRPEVPDVGGDVQIASFNVLNYFTTMESRGADDAVEFERQRTKIFAALKAIDADVVGLIEIENNNGEALADLVLGLNDYIGGDTYAAVETGTIGTDEITVAFIYKPSSVSLKGDFEVLDDPEFIDPNHIGEPKNRPALAQTFVETGTNSAFTVVVNHLKSKGSACGDGDDDPEQGNCNATRTLAVQSLVSWLSKDPTNSGVNNMVVIGDLNTYAKEDPIRVFQKGVDGIENTEDDFVDLNQNLNDASYSYVFNGQFGYLDYALANQHTYSKISDVAIWHINADEPDILDYDMSYKQDAQDALYEPNPYRSSDHDPVIIGLNLCDDQPPPPWFPSFCHPHIPWPPRHQYIHGKTSADTCLRRLRLIER